MQWIYGIGILANKLLTRKTMAVIFPKEIKPRFGLKVKFDFSSRGTQYLDFFKITVSNYKDNTHTFTPLNLSFSSYMDLYDFLTSKGIIYDEVEINTITSNIEKTITVVDCSRIFDIEDSVSKYLLNYKYYSINEVAEMLSFSRPTVYKLVKGNALKAVRICGQLRINHLDLMEFTNQENQK